MRLILRLAGVVLVLAVLGVVGVLLIPAERVANAAARQFTALTGRQLQIEGSVRPSFWPDLGVRTGPVTIANADWSEAGPMLQAEGLQIGVNLSGLFGGQVHVTGLEAIRPRLLLERSADGQENWRFGKASSDGTADNTGTVTTPAAEAPFTFDRLELVNGSVTFADHRADQTWTVDTLDLVASGASWTGPLDLTATGRMNDQNVAVTGSAGVLSDLVAGRVVPLILALKAGTATADFNGRGGLGLLQAEGTFRAELQDLSAIAAAFGATAPALPEGLGARAVGVSGALTLAPQGGVFLRDAKLELDDNAFDGAADISFDGPRPKLTAKFTGGQVTLPPTQRAASNTPRTTSDGQDAGWSDTPIDVSALALMDADVGLTMTGLTAGGVTFGETRLRMVIDRARAVFDIAQAEAYGGGVTGQFVVNGRSGLSMGGDLTFSALAMQPLLTDAAGYDRLSGTGDLTVKFLAVGDSMAALTKGLSGSGSLAFSQGELRGLDVIAMLRTLDVGAVGEGQATDFDAVTASFAIADGVLANEDLAMTGPDLTATGAGRVDIGARTIDYRLRPTALVKEDGSGGVTVPLIITGGWNDPRFRLDLESIARERMEEEARELAARARARADELEAEAKAELETRLREELGVEMAPGEDLGDATRRRAQEALDAEADRLLRDLLGNPEAPVAGD